MKIFNTFDTKLKQKNYDKSVFLFWEDKVLLISRSFAFWFFKWILPFIAGIIFSIGFVFIYNFLNKYYKPLWTTLLVIWIIFILLLLFRLYRVYLNYKFDFCIITPEEFITHKQKWVFISNYKNIPVEKVRSIQSRHAWIIWNIFNYWTITILTDWWEAAALVENDIETSWAWMIKLTFVNRPNKTKQKILLLCVHKWSLKDIEENKYKI